jgi:uncharacterized protein
VRAGGVRSSDVRAVTTRCCAWAAARPDVRAVGLAGSWARGTAGPGSDVDLVVLADQPDAYAGTAWAVEALGAGATDVGTRCWGPLLERRFLLPGGLVVDCGLAPPSWAAVPVDPGTARVVADGLVVLHDPYDLLARLVRAVAGSS